MSRSAVNLALGGKPACRRHLLEERFVLPIGAQRGYHMVGVGGGAYAVGPVLGAAADPNHVVKQSSPIGRTNYGTLLYDKTAPVVLRVGRAILLKTKRLNGQQSDPAVFP
jgi:hypothetical protein